MREKLLNLLTGVVHVATAIGILVVACASTLFLVAIFLPLFGVNTRITDFLFSVCGTAFGTVGLIAGLLSALMLAGLLTYHGLRRLLGIPQRYIPKIWYREFSDKVAKRERELGRALTDAEVQAMPFDPDKPSHTWASSQILGILPTEKEGPARDGEMAEGGKD